MPSAALIERIKKDILGKDYSLSLAYVSEKKSHELNKKFRKKDRPTNVLSFSLRADLGELVLCKPVIRREAKDRGEKFEEWLNFLVIHGLLHLKGLEHSSTMSKQEKIYNEKYFGGHRRRLVNDENNSGRIRQGRKIS